MRKLRRIEEQELKRLENLKDLYISEMMGKCELINEFMKEVRSGSWYERMKNIALAIDREKENEKTDEKHN